MSKTSKKVSKVSWKTKAVLAVKIIIVLYVVITLISAMGNWQNIVFSFTNKQDVEWVRQIKSSSWNETQTRIIENGKAKETKDNVIEAETPELPEELMEIIKDTPMAEMKDELAKNHYGISPYLIVGIAKAESSLGKAFVYDQDNQNYNFWGIKPPRNRRQDGSYLKWYASPEEAVKDCSRLLREVYVDQGFDTVEKIMGRYVGPEDYGWVAIVKSITSLNNNQITL